MHVTATCAMTRVNCNLWRIHIYMVDTVWERLKKFDFSIELLIHKNGF